MTARTQGGPLASTLTIDERGESLADSVVTRNYAMQPDLAKRYGPAGREKCVADARRHLSYLAEAIRTNSPGLFADYVVWAKVVLAGLAIPATDLTLHLQILRDVLAAELPAPESDAAARVLDAGLAHLAESPDEPTTFLRPTGPLGDLPRRYLEALLDGDRQAASRLVLSAVEDGASVRDVYLEVFQSSLHEIGRLWQTNRVTVAQEHFCSAATQLIMSQLYDRIFNAERNGLTLVATCVSGDLHEIGVRMVADFFEMEGWDTFYLGANTPTRSVLETIRERAADVLAISATLTPNVKQVAELIAAVRASESCRDVVVLVGGHPFNIAPEIWGRIGADGSARDALGAVALASRVTRRAPHS